MIVGIGHVAYNVLDMKAAMEFYCGKLGFAPGHVAKNEDGSVRLQFLTAPSGDAIELFPSEGKTAVEGTFYAHLCLTVEDLDAACEELAAQGVAVERGRLVWIRDPDGNPIELSQARKDGA